MKNEIGRRSFFEMILGLFAALFVAKTVLIWYPNPRRYFISKPHQINWKAYDVCSYDLRTTTVCKERGMFGNSKLKCGTFVARRYFGGSS